MELVCIKTNGLQTSVSCAQNVNLVCQLAGWLQEFVGWLAGWLAGWLQEVGTGWLTGWLAGRWLAGCLPGWLAGWLADWLASWLAGGLVGKLIWRKMKRKCQLAVHSFTACNDAQKVLGGARNLLLHVKEQIPSMKECSF